MKQVEPDMWLNIVIKHPGNLYGADHQDSGETIANAKFQNAFFKEEDSKIFYKLLDMYYNLFTLYHHSFRKLHEKCQISCLDGKGDERFASIMEEFTNNFVEFFFEEDFVKNTFWNVSFQGF